MSRKHKIKKSSSGIYHNKFDIEGLVKPVHDAPQEPKLEVVLKCDSAGSVEVISSNMVSAAPPGVEIDIIRSAVGLINKSDILMAETGNRLIVGFQTDIINGLEKELQAHMVEVRLYNVIYKLISDLRNVCSHLIPPAVQEEIRGSAKVIKLFKSTRKGIIAGCEVLEGSLSVGQDFRIISAMGPVYRGKVESIKIENNSIQKAVHGQQIGIKISNFNKVRAGDLIESFHSPVIKKDYLWKPKGQVLIIS